MTGAWRIRILTALGLAFVAGSYALARALHEPAWPTDFDQIWHATRALTHGVDPWSVVGPGRAFAWDWPLFYPLPALLLSLPFSLLPLVAARVAFATTAGAVLGLAMGPRVRVLWPLALSAAFLLAAARTQWSPLLLASAWVPVLGAVLVAKPNVGLALLGAQRRWRDLSITLLSLAGILLLSFVARPDWFASWRSAVSTAAHVMPPVARPFGFVLLLYLLRWRRPEARVLLALACIPHTPSIYDLLPFFIACRTRTEALALALLTHAAFWTNIVTGAGLTFDEYADHLGLVLLWVVHMPVMLMILRRPNVSEPDLPTTGSLTRLEVTLAGVLVVAAFVFTWLPMITTR